MHPTTQILQGSSPPDPGFALGLFVALLALVGVMCLLVLISTAVRRREFDAGQTTQEDRIAVERDLLLRMYFRMENAKPDEDGARILSDLQEWSWNLAHSQHSAFAARVRNVTVEEIEHDRDAVFTDLKRQAKRLLDDDSPV